MSSTSSSQVFKASIKVLGKTYTASGETVVEALRGLKTGVAVGMSVLTVSRGEKTKERVLGNLQTRKLFNPNSTMREFAIKNTAILFDGL